MKQQTGEVAVDGTICYVPQQAWILNATFKENIIFGLPLDKQRFETHSSFSDKYNNCMDESTNFVPSDDHLRLCFSFFRYDDVIHQCSLKPDLAMLPSGDETEVNLSNNCVSYRVIWCHEIIPRPCLVSA